MRVQQNARNQFANIIITIIFYKLLLFLGHQQGETEYKGCIERLYHLQQLQLAHIENVTEVKYMPYEYQNLED
jgi:hypothetical protein